MTEFKPILASLGRHKLIASLLALWVLGQFAILAPAVRASRVPPVVARGACDA